MSFKYSQRSLDRMNGIDPLLLAVMKKAITISPIDFGIPKDGGVRSVERQQQLYAQGRTTPGEIITKADGLRKRSYHQTGKAVDVYAYVNRQASWDPTHLALIAGVIIATGKTMGVDIEWGGTFGSNKFKGWDGAHFQLKKK